MVLNFESHMHLILKLDTARYILSFHTGTKGDAGEQEKKRPVEEDSVNQEITLPSKKKKFGGKGKKNKGKKGK